jgi:capsular exopolysaccharide synthesis family protein
MFRDSKPEPVELMTWTHKSSAMAESFRATLTSILTTGSSREERRVVLITSPSPQEGKSTVITNLAIALAEIDQRVLLIDADLRRPRLHTALNQANTWGLSDLLRETTPCEDYPGEALCRKTHVPRLSFLPSGPGSVNVSKLLYSSRMDDLLLRFRNEFDAVLIDSPPVLRVADARILSRLADAVVLVFRAGVTTRESAALALNTFAADGAPVLGTILNDWNPRTMGHGHYGGAYTDGYQHASNL